MEGAMKKEILEKMRTALDLPIYVYQKSPTGYWCDKVTWQADAETWLRTRYFLTAGISCTCLGYLKFQKCKHIAMLSDDLDWPVSGVSGEIAIEETKRLMEVLGSDLPQSSKLWEPDREAIPEKVTVLTLGIATEDAPKAFDRISAIRKCGNAETLGISLRILGNPAD
jgi:hypothetical protein